MMANLFSPFDPASICALSMNWFSSTISFLVIPAMYWLTPARWISIWLLLMFQIHKEFKILIKSPKYLGSTLIFINLLVTIMINNFMGLFPYVFTCSSHLNFAMYLSVPLWMSFMIFGWTKNSIHMLAHLVPQGAPSALLPFLVIVETISNVIRPGTLAIRLTANMIAGHLLITLLSNAGPTLALTMLNFLVIAQILLLTLESAVAMIQAYVFSILMTLYSSEVN
uniref:ATP synthase subunit a n=1 Tax=Trigonopterus sp. 2 AH-2016 TaxID=1903836 RepID=A0A343C3Y9_9CUCU|nr:ATP synthase F0 subunit 6 [Trigonopterus sp. 2 AH-2016]